MIRILAKVVIHDITGFKKLWAILLSEDQYKKLGNNLVYCILKYEADIIKGLKFQEIFNFLKLKHFFTKYEEKILSNQPELQVLWDVLQDKYLQFITEILTCLKEHPKYNTLVVKIENEITSLKSDVDNLYSVFSLANSTDNSSDAPRRLPKDTPLDYFQQYLIQRYSSVNFSQTSCSSIRAPNEIRIELALINNADDKHFYFSDYSFLYEQECHRIYLNYSDIFSNDQRVVVLQGPPESGKTTLAKHLCKQWANGKLLQTFSHVIFVQLRDKQIANANSFEELIKIYMDTLGESINKEIFKVHGEYFLVILEGWDELPETLRCEDTFFHHLLSWKILLKATIVVITRSSVVVNLPADVCHRIEIIGFSKAKVTEYVDSYLDRDRSLTTQFWKQLRDLPHVKKFYLFLLFYVSLSTYFNKIIRKYLRLTRNSTLNFCFIS